MSKKKKGSFDTCAGTCGVLVRASETNADGMCSTCAYEAKSQKNLAIRKADQHALANAARELLSTVSKAGKGEPTSPAILNSFMDAIGGPQAAGLIMKEELDLVRGANLTPEQKAKWKYSPMATYKWMELVTRLSMKVDERETIDVETLSQDDLLANLQALTVDLAQSSPEFRKLMLRVILDTEPSLVMMAMSLTGISQAIDGESREVESDKPDQGEDELDFEEAS